MKQSSTAPSGPETGGKAPTKQQLAAIAACDKTADGAFVYAVASTGIFCRPSCASRLPKTANIRVYPAPEAAMAGGYRPCKRCRPHGQSLPDAEWVQQVIAYMRRHLAEDITVPQLAEACHGSESHLRRVFGRQTGLSPMACLKALRLEQAKQLLAQGELPAAKVGEAVGFKNPSHFSRVFAAQLGVTPLQYKKEAAAPKTGRKPERGLT